MCDEAAVSASTLINRRLSRYPVHRPLPTDTETETYIIHLCRVGFNRPREFTYRSLDQLIANCRSSEVTGQFYTPNILQRWAWMHFKLM